MIPVAVRPSPLELGRRLIEVPPGTTLAGIVAATVPERWRGQAVVRLAGHPVPADRWRLVRPKDGITVEITVVPAGGGQGLRLLLTVGVIALAAAAGPAGAGALGFTAGSTGALIAGAAISATVSTVGLLAVNSLVPVQQADLASGGRASPTYSLEGARNAGRPLGVVPVVLGRHRMTPPLAAASVTEIAGDDIYLRMLLCWGTGPITLEDLRIGETALAGYKGVETETDLGTVGAVPEVALYSNAILEEAIGEVLTQAGGWTSRTTGPDADEISIDVTFPNGLIRYSDNGKNIDSRDVDIEIQHRLVGEVDWVAEDNLYTVAKTHSTVRRSVRWAVDRGQYEVRLRRLTNDTPQTRVISDSVWAAIRTITHENPVAEPGVAITALRILASQQLSGVIDQLNGIVTSVCPDWDGEAWEAAATRNPASLFRWVLQGPAALRPVPDAEIDLDQLAYWHACCADRGYTCDLVVDWEATTEEILGIVAACGRAAVSRADGRWSVAIDEPKELVVQDFTPRSLEGFSQQRIYVEEAHALRIRFQNADAGYRLDERLVYADGYDLETSTRIEDAELPGVTSAALVHHFGRLMLARARFQQERTELVVDWRALIAQPGDLVRVAHDAVLWGTGWGRIAAIETDGEGDMTALTLDEIVTLSSGKSYVARIQRADGTGVTVDLVTAVGEQQRLVLASPLDAAELPAVGDQVIVGETGREAQILLVIGRQGRADLAATLSCVPYVDLSAVDAEPIPEFDSRVTLPAGGEVPIIEAVRSDDTVLQRDADGAVHLRALVTIWSDGARPATRIAGLELRWREIDSGEPWHLVQAPTDAVQVSLDGVERGERIEVQARWQLRTAEGAAPGAWSPAWQHTVVGPSLPPPDVTVVWQDGEVMRWQADLDIDHAGFVLRAATVAGQPWAQAAAVHDGVFAGSFVAVELLPASIVELLVKTVTRGGLESALEARSAVDLSRTPGRYTLAAVDYRALGWPGMVDGAELDGGDLTATSDTAMWPDAAAAAWPDPAGPAFDLAWNAVVYEALWAVPATAIAPDVVELEWALTGAGAVTVQWVSDAVVVWADEDAVELLFDDPDAVPADDELIAGTAVDIASTRPAVQYRGPLRVVLGETIRIVVGIDGGGGSRPRLTQLKLRHRARLETDVHGDQALASGGSRIPPATTMRQLVGVTALLSGAGDARIVRVMDKSDPVLGPLLQAFDAAGAPVAAVADVSITGV